MKLFKRLLTLLLALVLVISATACNNNNSSSSDDSSTPASIEQESSTPDSSTDSGENNEDEKVIDGPHMSERTYEHIDSEAAYAVVDEIKALCEGEGNLDALVAKRDEMFIEYYDKLSTYYTVASINYDLDVSNEYWKTESEYIENFYNEYHNTVLEVEKLIFQSSYADFFIEELGQDYADMILDAELETDEQLAIQARITELESDYTQKYQLGTASETTFASILAELVTKRNEYARTKKNAEGEYYSNFMEYAYAELYGREYTPTEAKSYRNAVKYFLYDVTKGAFSKYSTYKAKTTLSTSDIHKLMPQIIESTVPDMLSSWNYMIERGLYDFSVSNKKANTSYVTSFSEYGDAYMFINATGDFESDLSTLIHEFGHYNERFMKKESLSIDSVRSYDLAETHSQAFELITLPAVKAICQSEKYSNIEDLYETYTYNIIFGALFAITTGAAIDDFEYSIYTAPASKLNAKGFKEYFSLALGKYCPFNTGWTFYDIPHIYASPAYYISYSVSMIFSSAIWASNDAVNKYVKVVEYGSNNYLSTVANAVGVDYPMTNNCINKVAQKYKSILTSDFGVYFS